MASSAQRASGSPQCPAFGSHRPCVQPCTERYPWFTHQVLGLEHGGQELRPQTCRPRELLSPQRAPHPRLSCLLCTRTAPALLLPSAAGMQRSRAAAPHCRGAWGECKPHFQGSPETQCNGECVRGGREGGGEVKGLAPLKSAGWAASHSREPIGRIPSTPHLRLCAGHLQLVGRGPPTHGDNV